jgi:glycosyltransferase involved in cell wall biosynthesis
MRAPSISVVVPCYNAAPFVSTTLRSVFAQELPPSEVIVVDDGSGDGSADLVEREFPQVQLIRQANQGVAAARNSGIAASRGDWIAFIDADDYWTPIKLREQWERLQREPRARLAHSAFRGWWTVRPEPTHEDLAALDERAQLSARWRGCDGWAYSALLLDCVVWTSTVLMQRSLLDEVGAFDTRLRIGEDYDLWLRASRVTPFAFLQRPHALYRKHPTSITTTAPTDCYPARIVEAAVARWGYESPDGSRADPAEVRRSLASRWCNYAGMNVSAGQLERARRFGANAVRADWSHLPSWKVLAKAWAYAVVPRHGLRG